MKMRRLKTKSGIFFFLVFLLMIPKASATPVNTTVFNNTASVDFLGFTKTATAQSQLPASSSGGPSGGPSGGSSSSDSPINRQKLETIKTCDINSDSSVNGADFCYVSVPFKTSKICDIQTVSVICWDFI